VIVWKVTNSDKRSVVARFLAEVQYKMGKPAKAPQWFADRGYYLFAFSRLKDAREYVTGINNRVYRAEGKNVTRKLPQFCDTFEIDMRRLTISQSLGGNRQFPKNTVMCEEITLLKEVI